MRRPKCEQAANRGDSHLPAAGLKNTSPKNPGPPPPTDDGTRRWRDLVLARVRREVTETGAPGEGAHLFGTEVLRGACICLGEFVHMFLVIVLIWRKAECMPLPVHMEISSGNFKKRALSHHVFCGGTKKNAEGREKSGKDSEG